MNMTFKYEDKFNKLEMREIVKLDKQITENLDLK